MKRSRAVSLVVLGTIGLAGCGPSEFDKTVDVKQHSYQSKEDCQKDWGNDERECKLEHRPGGGFFYMGPHYFYNHAGGYPMAVNPDGTTRQLSNSSRMGSAPDVPPTNVAGTTSSKITRSGGATSAARGGFGSSSAASAGG